ncbi:MAG: hypothetical protein PUF32_06565 [Prevotella sp.]|nr:hypothetical protein [Prevotella sp.]
MTINILLIALRSTSESASATACPTRHTGYRAGAEPRNGKKKNGNGIVFCK